MMSSSRQSICTHSSVARVFDSSELQTCDTCKKPSRLGWVYICTEDHDSFLPNHEAAGFFSASNPSVLKRVESSIETPQLNTWVTKAIADGYYTSEQIEILKEQRANVQKAVSSIATTPRESEEGDNPFTQLFEQLKGTHITAQADNNSVAESTKSEKPEKKNEALSVAIPACRYRVCPACRPLTRDRAWVSLNRVCDDDNYKGPPDWEFLNRRVSSLPVVQNIGLLDKEPTTTSLTSSERVILTPHAKKSPKNDEQPTPAKTTPKKTYEAARRPSVGRGIPLKRTARGSFSRGHEGLLYFGNDKHTDASTY
jgi:hypothetical protein